MKANTKRLENVARALDDAEQVPFLKRMFNMGLWSWGRGKEEPCTGNYASTQNCGTPACAMGHYASRDDLQRTFYLDSHGDVVLTRSGVDSSVTDFIKHFSLNGRTFEELFGGQGCGNAKTPGQAAKYIRRFIKNHV